MRKRLFTKEELEIVLTKTKERFKHIEPAVILLLYGYIKKKKIKEKKLGL